MISVLLYGPWGCYDIAEAVVEFIEFGDIRKCPPLQIWGRNLPSIQLASTSGSDDDSEYLPGDSYSPRSFGDLEKLESMDLTPNSRKWFINNDNLTSELGIQSNMSFEDFSALSPEIRFAADMWNSPATSLPSISWRGSTPGLKVPLDHCHEPIDFFMLYWPVNILQRIVKITNLYATNHQENGGTKGGVSWFSITQSELLCFFGILMLMTLKKLPNTRLHWARAGDLFRTDSIANIMSRGRFESIIRCILLLTMLILLLTRNPRSLAKSKKQNGSWRL
jgi:hypothetical protein